MKVLKHFFCLMITALPLVGTAQVVDDFSDGDFTTNPTWSGDVSKFVINTGNTLQSNGSQVATDTLILTVPNNMIDSAEWQFYMKLDFNPTATGNYVKVYLVSDNADLSGSLNGYYLRIGETGSSDTLELFRQTGTTETKILTGSTAFGATTEVSIKVTRDNAGNWSLFADPNVGMNYNFEGTVNDVVHTTTSFFGVFCRYSTVSRFDQYFFDDIFIGNIIGDTLPPAVSTITVTSDTTLDVIFNEVVEQSSSETLLNYSADNGLNAPASAVRDATDSSIVHLEFNNQFQNGVTNTLTINNIADNAGNAITGNVSETFLYFLATPAEIYDIVINEIFPDPSPAINLPEAEFVELYNNSSKILDLTNYTFSDASSTTVLSGAVLLPGEYLILCANADTALFQPFGTVLGVSSMPTLNNSSDDLSLRSNTGLLVHAVSYSSSWYNDGFKDDGGWTLEMIDPSNPCSEELNWTASNNFFGGTPGFVNSVFSSNPDTEAPKLQRADALDTLNVLLTFDEPLDSQSIATISYVISPSVTIVADSLVTTSTIKLTLAANLSSNVAYKVTVTGATDCVGNTIGVDNTAQFALAEQALVGDLIINEILSNPTTDGSDFIEVYNNSTRFIDLNGWQLANLDNDTIDNIKAISDAAYVVFPGDYVLLTTSTSDIKSEYPLGDENTYLQIASMPTYSNDDGTVILLNNLFEISDSITYNSDMHLSLLNDDDGVSLERLDFNRPTFDLTNWLSAAEAVGFATPGYKNSQSNPADSVEGDVVVLPEIFSPDNDGVNDVVDINYAFEAGGFIGSIFIYDAKGRLIKTIVQNELLGTAGTFSWDGTLENGEKGRVGIYIVYFEAFGLLGEIKQFKRSCVLAGKL